MELNEYQRRRLDKAHTLRQRGVDPYPARSQRTHTVAELWQALALPEERVCLRGQIQRMEGSCDLVAGRDRLQLAGLPASYSLAEEEVVCCGHLTLSDQGRLTLHLEGSCPTVEESSLPLRTIAQARQLCLEQVGPVWLTGRLVGGMRSMGRVIFADLEDGSVLQRGHDFLSPHIQLFLSEAVLGKEAFQTFGECFDSGDFVEAHGSPTFTRMGQFSLQVSAVRMLAKALNPPPEKYHGLADVETRLRQRYADLLANEAVRHRFRQRSQIISALRRFLDDRGYLEVETPILQPIYGGAAARPFTTYHRQLDQELYLRISFELYLKRLLVGMYDGVYEIGKDFRNEGVDWVHSPEFTQLEVYVAYADYQEMMRLFEEMIASVAREVVGDARIVYQGQQIDLTPPWPRRSLRGAIEEATGIDLDRCSDAERLYEAMRGIGAEVDPQASWAAMVDKLLSRYVEPTLIQPVFLTDYPVSLSPLAKRRPDRSDLVERFEGFVAGAELCNAFSELNDPLDQEERFLAQGRALEAGDEEAHPMDRDFVQALMYGMPPAGGLGMGVDRLAMLLTDQTTLREVIFFPHMRQL